MGDDRELHGRRHELVVLGLALGGVGVDGATAEGSR